MRIRSKEEAIGILSNYLDRIAKCINNAWKDLEEIPAQIRADMSSRTRAAFVNDRTQIHSRREFGSDRHVAFLRGRGGLFILAICESFLLRFKKFKPNLRTSNIPTQQSLDFARQRGLELPNMPPTLTHINAGYVLNRIQTEVAATYLTCPVGKRLEWVIDLSAVSLGEVVEMPRRKKQPKTRTTIVPKTATPKRIKASEEDGNDDNNSNDQR